MKISKKVFLGYLDCKSKGHLILNESHAAPTEADSFRIQQGREIEAMAQSLFPNRIKIEGDSFAETCKKTAAVMALHPEAVFFEGSFETDSFRARADILVPVPGGYHLIEVKSKTDKTKDVETLHVDAAYTAMVLKQARIEIKKVSVWVISKEYRSGMSPSSLFTEWDVTAEVTALIDAWLPVLDDVIDACRNGVPGAVAESCRGCVFFQNGCVGEGVANHVLTIPNLRGKKLDRLLSAGLESIEGVPADADLTDKQAMVVESVQLGRPVLAGDLSGALDQLEYPLRFLDFETVSTALPLYPDLSPWEQCVCQFSIHTLYEDGRLHHAKFLAAPEQDCRLVLASSLLDELGVSGNILVYSSFERVTVQTLAKMYPDLAGPLQSCIDRFVDLLSLIRTHYYHPKFRGSYSIKKVLPAMLPDFTYDGLGVTDGDAAITRFARMARNELTLSKILQARRDLLAYCRQDTLAMVLLLDQLFQTAGLQPILLEEAA